MPNPIRIYTASYCSYCHRAKQLLEDRGIDFEDIDVTTDFEMRKRLVELTGRRTVPQIFIGERSIGGYDDLRELDRSGELGRLVGG
jgi:glutaredoxin 3